MDTHQRSLAIYTSCNGLVQANRKFMPLCYFPTIISMSYIKKDLGVGYDAPPSNKGKIEYHQGLLYVPFKHLKSRWIIILEANPPKRDMNLAGSRKFLALVVLTVEKQPFGRCICCLYKMIICHCDASSLEGNSSFLPSLKPKRQAKAPENLHHKDR